jgi:hypothetical protein
VVLPHGSIETKVNTWVDTRGFVHSIESLRRQLLYNDWVSHYGPPGAPLLVVTGILDRPTLWSESQEMHYQLSKLRQTLLKQRLADAAGSVAIGSLPSLSSIGTNDLLAPAAEALAQYDRELQQVRFSPPSAVVDADCNSSPHLFYKQDHYVPLEDKPESWEAPLEPPSYPGDPDFKNIDHQFQKFSRDGWTVQDGKATRMMTFPTDIADTTNEAVDPNSVSVDMTAALSRLEEEARRRIEEAALQMEAGSGGQR